MSGTLDEGNEIEISSPQETCCYIKKMAETKASIGQPRWKTKPHPFFVSVAEHDKKIVQLSRTGKESDRQESQRMIRNPPAELVEEARRIRDERARLGIKASMSATTLLTVNDRYPATPDMSDEQFTLGGLPGINMGRRSSSF